MGRTKAVKRHVVSTKPPTPRPPDVQQLLADLESIEGIGLRAAVELRGIANHDLADMLCDVIERVHTIRGAVVVRLREASMLPAGGVSHG